MKRIHHKLMNTLIGVCVVLLAACSSAGTSGTSDASGTNSTTRSVTGALTSGSTAALKFAVSDSCLADTVIFTDTSAQAESAAVTEDCSFDMPLNIGKSYSIGFVLNDTFIASLAFDSGSAGFTSSTLPIVGSDTAIDLGRITIAGNLATPEANPLGQIDSDDDGIDDLSDDDDDGDGTGDDIEDDCDLDGIIDDNEDDGEDEMDEACISNSDGSDGEAKILEVKPRNDSQVELSEYLVDLNKKVKVRISCEIDQTTVTGETFAIASESGDHVVACTFDYSTASGVSKMVACRHDGDDFLPGTVYTAIIEGILCSDGTPVQTRSWSWTTETEDDDDGDAEDDLDDSYDDEGDDSGEDEDEDDSEVDEES